MAAKLIYGKPEDDRPYKRSSDTWTKEIAEQGQIQTGLGLTLNWLQCDCATSLRTQAPFVEHVSGWYELTKSELHVRHFEL